MKSVSEYHGSFGSGFGGRSSPSGLSLCIISLEYMRFWNVV